MPKKKTRKAVSKRVKITPSGKVKYPRPGRGHLLGGKSRKRKRQMHKRTTLGPADFKRISAMLP